MSLRLRMIESGDNGKRLVGRSDFTEQVLDLLKRIRNIEYVVEKSSDADVAASINKSADFATILENLETSLSSIGKTREAEALHRTIEHCLEIRSQGGLQLSRNVPLTASAADKVLFRVEAWLESLNSAEQARRLPKALVSKPAGRRSMTLSEKIFAHHAIGISQQGIQVGDVIRVAVDWVIASEISWVGMMKTLSEFKDYKVWRNDRFWLAGDHVVDPRNYETDLSKRLIAASDKAANDFKLTDYKGPNYTIIHTEFVRARAEPGMLAIGSDSHTCSSGAVGCLAIGLGAADVAMPLVTGETWFTIPEIINVRFVGQPGPGIGGKDTIMFILGQLKRNTVAAERIVEFSGPGLKYLSVDARFAICNMCTEFGAITGVFVPDETTHNYISTRRQKIRKSSSLYFQPDEDCHYADSFDIDLAKVQSTIAVYPNPDDIQPISEKAGMHLDGVFIGACTTALEDLILAALVLQAGVKKGLTLKNGKRHVVPGSLPVGQRLEELGLTDAFREAGFEIGLPGCSFCVGMGSDQAKEGETWLSSQNRNFQNRMGKGSFGNLASAATVAASSFAMEITDPSSLLAEVDMDSFDEYRKHSRKGPKANPSQTKSSITYVEPGFDMIGSGRNLNSELSTDAPQPSEKLPDIISRIVRLGDYIDTDALAPAQYLVTVHDDEGLGSHCLEATHPDFRDKVKSGQTVVVAEKAFGVGSSREEAVRALKGAGVKCVIAKSFAFIYGRNQPNLGLLGFKIHDDTFYELAIDNADIEINIEDRVIKVGGKDFRFELNEIEKNLLVNRGMSEAYKKFGAEVFNNLRGGSTGGKMADLAIQGVDDAPDALQDLQW